MMLPHARCLCLILFISVVWIVAGCNPTPRQTPVTEAPAPPSLRLLVIDDPGLAKVIQREWQARAEAELVVSELTTAEFQKWDQPRLGADAILFPTVLLGDLAGRDWIAAIPDEVLEDVSFQFRDIFPAIRKQELIWGEDTFAVPLGGPPLLLFYRRDIFDKLQIKPPETWEEYAAAAEQLKNKDKFVELVSTSGGDWFATCEPLKDIWAGQLMLARAACYAKHRSQFSALFDYRTMRPLIDGTPFVRATTELAGVAHYFPAQADQFSPTDAVKLLADGRCGMAIGWLADINDWAVVTSPGPSADIGVVPLPGSFDVYNFRSSAWEKRRSEESPRVPLVGISGRQGALTKECRSPAAATRFLTWLSGPEMSLQISPASPSTAPCRGSHVSQIKQWTGPHLSVEAVDRYAQAIQLSQSESNCLTGLRVPGHEDYLSALSNAVKSVIAKKEPAETSLGELAKNWDQITDRLDREKQRLAYMQSIGLRP